MSYSCSLTVPDKARLAVKVDELSVVEPVDGETQRGVGDGIAAERGRGPGRHLVVLWLVSDASVLCRWAKHLTLHSHPRSKYTSSFT
jgi:hypothetical protein